MKTLISPNRFHTVIENEAARKRVVEWFLGPDGRVEDLQVLYVVNADDWLVVVAVLHNDVMDFVRLFKIGDRWELSVDAQYNVQGL